MKMLVALVSCSADWASRGESLIETLRQRYSKINEFCNLVVLPPETESLEQYDLVIGRPCCKNVHTAVELFRGQKFEADISAQVDVVEYFPYYVGKVLLG